MNEIQGLTWDFDGKADAVLACDVDGKPYFASTEAARALGYKDPEAAVTRHCKGSRISRPLRTSGGVQDVSLISEGDVYRLIIRSNKPKAQAFERLVFDTILPAIREGKYAQPLSDREILERGWEILARKNNALEADLAIKNDTIVKHEETINKIEPAARAFNEFVTAEGRLTLTEAAKNLNMPRNVLIDWMVANEWLYRRGGKLLPYQPHCKNHDMAVKIDLIDKPGYAGKQAVAQAVVTQIGLAKLQKIFLPPKGLFPN